MATQSQCKLPDSPLRPFRIVTWRWWRWEQIASMATFLKQAICQGLGIPCIASYHFTNEARKEFKKKHGLPSLADIAASAEIANLLTVCLGMTQDKTPETTHLP